MIPSRCQGIGRRGRKPPCRIEQIDMRRIQPDRDLSPRCQIMHPMHQPHPFFGTVMQMDEGFRAGDFRHAQGAVKLHRLPGMFVQFQMIGPETCQIAAIRQGCEGPAGRGIGGIAEIHPVALFEAADEIHRRIRKHTRRGRIGWLAVDARRGAKLRDAAFPQSGGIAAQQQRLFRLGRGIDKDRARSLEDARNLDAQFLAQFVIQIGQWLVQQHQPRPFHQRPRQRAALLLPARKLQRFARQHRGQLHHLGGLFHRAVDFSRRAPHQPQRRGDVVIDAHRRIVDELLIDHGDAAILHAHPGHILPVPENPPGRGHIQPRHQPHQAGLACGCGAEQHIHRALFQRQIGGVDVNPPHVLCVD
eukprot:Opistho-1_new@9015